MAQRPPRRSIAIAQVSVSGTPGALEDDVGAEPPGELADRGDRVAGGRVDGHEPHGRGLLQAVAAADDDHPGGAADGRRVAGEQADRARHRSPTTVSPGLMLPRRATCSAMLAGSTTAPSSKDTSSGSRKTHFTSCTDVGGVAAGHVVPVLGVQPGLAVVLAEVVLPLDALLAGPAGVVAGAGDPVAHRPAEGLRRLAEGDDLAGPLVAGGEREGRGPEAGVVAVDQVCVGAADGRRPHPGEHLVGPRHGGPASPGSPACRAPGPPGPASSRSRSGLPVGCADAAGLGPVSHGSAKSRVRRWCSQRLIACIGTSSSVSRRLTSADGGWEVGLQQVADRELVRPGGRRRRARRRGRAAPPGSDGARHDPADVDAGQGERDEGAGERARAGRRRAAGRGSPRPRRSGGGSGRRPR